MPDIFQHRETISYVVISRDSEIEHYETLKEAVAHWGDLKSLRAVVSLSEGEYQRAQTLSREHRR